MNIRVGTRRGMLLVAGMALALFGGVVPGGATTGSPPAAGPQVTVEPNVVLSGSYSCYYTVTSYYTGPIVDPSPPPQTFAETTDSLTLGTTGGTIPADSRAPGIGGIGPGFGGVPTVRGSIPIAPPVPAFSAGHSFNEGSIEDCVRFAQAMSAAAKGLGCATSDVRRRQPPQTISGNSASASFNFVCEGPQADIVHDVGELSRAVLALKLQSV